MSLQPGSYFRPGAIDEASDQVAIQLSFAATLVDEWCRAGVAHAVCSPGSRSTPMALALSEAAERGELKLHVRLDERSAGFFALGLALATKRACIVLTTSGTAAAEVHPAVAEADRACVPLVVCTANRPPELQGVGAPQTMDQRNLFGQAARWSFAPGVPDSASLGSWRSLAARTIAEAESGPAGPGPVHLDLAFREPLVGAVGPLPPGRPGGRPWHAVLPALAQLAESELQELSDQLAEYKGAKGLIVAGSRSGESESVKDLAELLGWPIMADPRSAMRLPGTIGSADAILRSPEARGAMQPEIVLRLGTPWASKVLNQWLGSLDVVQVLVDPHWQWSEPYRVCSWHVVADPNRLCRDLLDTIAPDAGFGESAHAISPWTQMWSTLEHAAQEAIRETLASSTGSEPEVLRSIFASATSDDFVVVGSSMPIRDLEWFGAPRFNPPVVLSNRGVNGIDGTVSTALGVAAAYPLRRTWAVMGDLAFHYDAAALLGSRSAGLRADMVVLDNQGGGIFSFLPQAQLLQSATFESLFGTPQDSDVLEVAAAYGAQVHEASSVEEIVQSEPPSGVRVWCVRSDREKNKDLHDKLHEAVGAAVESALQTIAP